MLAGVNGLHYHHEDASPELASSRGFFPTLVFILKAASAFTSLVLMCLDSPLAHHEGRHGAKGSQHGALQPRVP